jgi:hypothetical protein
VQHVHYVSAKDCYFLGKISSLLDCCFGFFGRFFSLQTHHAVRGVAVGTSAIRAYNESIARPGMVPNSIGTDATDRLLCVACCVICMHYVHSCGR